MDGYAFIPSTSSSSSSSNVVYTSKDFHYCLKKKKKIWGVFYSSCGAAGKVWVGYWENRIRAQRTKCKNQVTRKMNDLILDLYYWEKREERKRGVGV